MELSHDKRQNITLDYNHYVTPGSMGGCVSVGGGLYRAVKCGQTGGRGGQIKCYNNKRTNGPKIPNQPHNAIQLNASQTTVEQMGNKTGAGKLMNGTLAAGGKAELFVGRRGRHLC